jgi:PQQ-dependent dehydrogenase (methanol/ethanol family)
MRRIVWVGTLVIAAAAAALLLSTTRGGAALTAKLTREASIPVAPAFTAQQLSANAGADWLNAGGGLQDNRFSTLNQITGSNVGGLKVAWQTTLGLSKKQIASLSEEGSPIEYQGVLYVPDGASDVFAYDATTGAKLWEYQPTLTGPALIPAVRGLALGNGLVYEARSDGVLVALDQQTGSVVWSDQVGRTQDGESFSAAPVYYNGRVIVGVSGGDWGGRGFALAVDAATGLEQWRWYVTPSPGELGFGSWPVNSTEWEHGGAIWIYPSIDTQSGLLYLVTGNPIPWNGRGPGDDLWSDSIVALHVDNGGFAWGFQTVHHDIWDYDVTNPPVQFDATIKGQLRHGIAVASKTGWVYILDRDTGEPLIGITEKKVQQFPKGSAAAKYANLSPTQPVPVGDAFVNQCSTRKEWPQMAPDGKPFKVGCIFTPYAPTAQGSFLASDPSDEGGVDWPPSAYNAGTQLEYICARDGAGGGIGAVPKGQYKLVPGQLDLGANFAPASKVRPDFGRVAAINVTTNKLAWRVTWAHPCFSGVMTTAGGLVFVGQGNGGLIAYDAASGKQLWTSGNLGAGFNSPSIAYSVNGKEYIATLAAGNALAFGTPGDKLVAFSLP